MTLKQQQLDIIDEYVKFNKRVFGKTKFSGQEITYLLEANNLKMNHSVRQNAIDAGIFLGPEPTKTPDGSLVFYTA